MMFWSAYRALPEWYHAELRRLMKEDNVTWGAAKERINEQQKKAQGPLKPHASQ
jgi:hypothetical protein